MIKEEIEIGSDIFYNDVFYGTLMSITPKGMYSVRWVLDNKGEPRTYFTKEQFYNNCVKVED